MEWSQLFKQLRLPLLIIAILLVSLWIRLDYIAKLEVTPISDMQDYDQRALRLVEEGTFVTGERHGATYRAPGYVMFLASLYELFGHKYRLVYGVQALLSVATLYAIYLIGRRLFEAKVALLALLLAALYLPFIGYSGVLLTESLFLFLFLYALYSFLCGAEEGRVGWFLLAGGLFGLAALTRSIALLLPALCLIWLFWQRKTWRLPRATWLHLCLMVLVMMLVITPWTIRNYAEQREWVLIDTTSGLNLLIGNNDRANGFFTEAIYGVPAYKEAMSGNRTDAEADRIMKRGAKAWIVAHPQEFAELTWMRFKMYLSAQNDWLASTYKWNWIKIFSDNFYARYQWTLMSLGLIGAFFALWKERNALFPTLVAGYFLGAISFFFVQTRYQLPAMPFVILLAAFVLGELGRSRRRALCIFAAVFLIGWWLEELAIQYKVL